LKQQGNVDVNDAATNSTDGC